MGQDKDTIEPCTKYVHTYKDNFFNEQCMDGYFMEWNLRNCIFNM